MMLDRVSIAAPCPADWDSMAGTDQVRHCSQCNRNVYNLSAMTRRQAEAVLRETEGHLCARLYRRADGTIITENCSVGLRTIGRRISRVAGAALSAMATLSSATAAQFPMFPIPSVLREARSSLSGIVKDCTGEGIPGAQVAVSRPGSDIVRSMTDGSGRFRLDALPLGPYRIKVSAPGFASADEDVTLLPLHEYRLTTTLHVGSMGAAVDVHYAK